MHYGKLSWALLIGLVTASGALADDWPQWLGPKRDGVWRETGILKKFPPEGLKPRWRVPVAEGYSGPAVANGIVYITDWVRDRGVVPPKSPFDKARQAGTERVLAIDEATGKILWKHEYPAAYTISYAAGPRCTPVVDAGKVYTLGSMGDLICFEAKTGKVLWQRDFVEEFQAPVPLWGFAAHPLIDGDQIICLVGGEGSVVMSLDKNTGQERWRALNASEIGYCPPMIFTVGRTRQLIIWHPDAIVGLDPATGKQFWSQEFKIRAGLSIPTPRLTPDNRLFVSSFYNGSMMLQLSDPPAAKLLWRGKKMSEMPRNTDGLHSIMTTPFIIGDYIYGICSYGQLRCLKADTGERVWEDLRATGGKLARWGHAFLIEQGGRFFLFNEHGELIIAKLTPKGYEEIDRTRLIEPTNVLAGRDVVWMHPAFANRTIFARNDRELIAVSLAE
jgi:outer membrane protein assembly factor BamB